MIQIKKPEDTNFVQNFNIYSYTFLLSNKDNLEENKVIEIWKTKINIIENEKMLNEIQNLSIIYKEIAGLGSFFDNIKTFLQEKQKIGGWYISANNIIELNREFISKQSEIFMKQEYEKSLEVIQKLLLSFNNILIRNEREYLLNNSWNQNFQITREIVDKAQNEINRIKEVFNTLPRKEDVSNYIFNPRHIEEYKNATINEYKKYYLNYINNLIDYWFIRDILGRINRLDKELKEKIEFIKEKLLELQEDYEINLNTIIDKWIAYFYLRKEKRLLITYFNNWKIEEREEIPLIENENNILFIYNIKKKYPEIVKNILVKDFITKIWNDFSNNLLSISFILNKKNNDFVKYPINELRYDDMNIYRIRKNIITFYLKGCQLLEPSLSIKVFTWIFLDNWAVDKNILASSLQNFFVLFHTKLLEHFLGQERKSSKTYKYLANFFDKDEKEIKAQFNQKFKEQLIKEKMDKYML